MGVKITKQEVLVETYVDVEVEIEVDEVVEFIESANKSDLQTLQSAIDDRALPMQASLAEFDYETLRHLVERANMFGIDDMLDSLSREAERCGLYLRGDV